VIRAFAPWIRLLILITCLPASAFAECAWVLRVETPREL
jgi:hypothetical protein